MAANTRVAHCVFCDDVRHEVGNKLSLMGIYFGELLFPQAPPIVLPKFCIVLWILTEVDDPIHRIATTVHVPPDSTEVIKIEMDPSPPDILEGAQKIVWQQVIPVTPFPIMAEGMIEVYAETEREKMRAGRLRIRRLESPQQQTTSIF